MKITKKLEPIFKKEYNYLKFCIGNKTELSIKHVKDKCPKIFRDYEKDFPDTSNKEVFEMILHDIPLLSFEEYVFWSNDVI